MTKPRRQDKVNGELPAGSMRIMRLVERSQPVRERPRISEEFEAQLQRVHGKSAACYASMEDLGDQLERLAGLIDDAESVVVSELAEDDSVVMHIDEVTNELQNSRTRLAAIAPPTPAPTLAIALYVEAQAIEEQAAKEDVNVNEATQLISLRERALTH